MKVAVVGSRKWVGLSRVEAFMGLLWNNHPGAIVVSGGAQGVDKAAELAWLGFGGSVISFRPNKLGLEEYAVNRYEFKDGLGAVVPLELFGHPTWATFEGAAFYRNMLIAEEADRGVAFWDGRSGGTAGTIDSFRAEGKEIDIFRP